ncbi:SEC10/PgrA surface exclusion domain-containing protein [Limosilactobacillus fermentum]|uniref:LPXTG cell wall anchor domain-containing protein n=1 Tax=Limosilactobacillus fermentum TaxID=1613 RepID=UPI0023E3A5DE|nr:SEC10/PgrA surface exclusion domain-containing protein [Limosilactobacillus fermentum]MDF4007027.1 SEC10/PgrA surface exclusion domain-containing protein [Limosilactobacillus fermentum]MDF4016027.1 SEC10/PgrA surface exclusion domain-containing protein [Limosilactobacillus fermentum]
MNKKKMIRLTALVGVATATGVVAEANQAHAATTTTTETTNQTTNASVESTQAAVDAAQSAFDTAQTSVDNAQANVTSASNNVTSASATLSSAIANKEAATSENIASATSAVSSQAVVVASASQAVSEQAGVVSAAASVQASAQAEATSASASLSSSSANVASALSAAEAALTSDQSTAANNLSAAESAASSASAAVSSDQAAVDNAQAAVASAQAIVDAVAEVQSSDVINMSVAYITALKNYLANPSSANAAALQEVAKGADYVKELQQKFKSDASLDVVVDPSDPTVQEALSVYAVNLINHLRNQYGLTTAFGASANANVAAIDFVKKYYDDEDWNIFGTTGSDGQGHNKNGLDAYADQLNTSIAEDAGSGLTTWVNGKATMATTTLHNLLYAVYSDIATMLFDDGGTNNWSHAQSIFEDGTILGTGGFNNVYLGVAFDKYGYAHYELYNATEGNQLGNNAYSLDVQTAAQASLEAAQATLATAKAKLAELEETVANLTNADQLLAAAQAAYEQAVANLTTATGNLGAAQVDLAKAESQLALAEDTAEQAKVRAAIAAQVDQQLNGSTANDRQSAGQDATSLKTNGRTLTATVATASTAKQKQGANQGRLPQTGNDDQEASTMALVGLGMLGMATGLYGYKKKKLTK